MAGGKEEAVKDRNIRIDARRGVAVAERNLVSRRETRRAHRADGGHPQIALGAGITQRSLVAEARAGEIRAILEGLHDQVGWVREWRGGHRLLGEIERLRIGESEGVGQFRVRRLLAVLRLHEQQLRLRQVHLGEAYVHQRPQLVLFECGDLIGKNLARFHRFLSNLEYGLGAQDAEVGAIDGQQHVLCGLLRALGSWPSLPTAPRPPGWTCARSR